MKRIDWMCLISSQQVRLHLQGVAIQAQIAVVRQVLKEMEVFWFDAFETMASVIWDLHICQDGPNPIICWYTQATCCTEAKKCCPSKDCCTDKVSPSFFYLHFPVCQHLKTVPRWNTSGIILISKRWSTAAREGQTAAGRQTAASKDNVRAVTLPIFTHFHMRVFWEEKKAKW